MAIPPNLFAAELAKRAQQKLAVTQAELDSVVAGTTPVPPSPGSDPDVLVASSATLTNGAGAAAGTLANAPSAGDPTKWVAIDDNGTTRWIPTWESP